MKRFGQAGTLAGSGMAVSWSGNGGDKGRFAAAIREVCCGQWSGPGSRYLSGVCQSADG
jgi:hypothetical protein